MLLEFSSAILLATSIKVLRDASDALGSLAKHLASTATLSLAFHISRRAFARRVPAGITHWNTKNVFKPNHGLDTLWSAGCAGTQANSNSILALESERRAPSVVCKNSMNPGPILALASGWQRSGRRANLSRFQKHSVPVGTS